MKISEYILELLTNEHEANLLEDEQNFYGADVCREEFDADWEDWIYSLTQGLITIDRGVWRTVAEFDGADIWVDHVIRHKGHYRRRNADKARRF